MKTYKDSFEINLGPNYMLAGLTSNTIPLLELYNLEETELRTLILFLILNLSIPGSIMLAGTNFKADTRSIHIEISDYFFASSLEWSNNFNWPNILRLPVKDVAMWYKRLNIGRRQISKNNLERVIFSLLHVCTDTENLSGLIWLDHSLESLLGSPKSSISTTIINRSFKILGEPKQGSKKIKKLFNDFYDIRSRYVHGEFNIHHPSLNEILDGNLDEYYNKIQKTEQIGFSIVVACIQLLILNNWKGFEFTEEMKGIEVLSV